MQKYMTRQRRGLLEYLQSHPDMALSAGQIAAAVQGGEISVSAVYRNLAALEEEGKVRRLSRSGSREVFFQYMDAGECRNCLHLSCTKCGRTFHMHALGAAQLVRDVAQNDQFQIDRSETVLYGVCRACQGTKGGAAR